MSALAWLSKRIVEEIAMDGRVFNIYENSFGQRVCYLCVMFINVTFSYWANIGRSVGYPLWSSFFGNLWYIVAELNFSASIWFEFLSYVRKTTHQQSRGVCHYHNSRFAGHAYDCISCVHHTRTTHNRHFHFSNNSKSIAFGKKTHIDHNYYELCIQCNNSIAHYSAIA